jgi:hypothetical protein
VQVGGLGVHLRLPLPANDDVAEQGDPPSRSEHGVRPPPADGRIDPVPRRRRHERVEAPAAVVPLLERGFLDADVAEGLDPATGERGHPRTRLDGRHRAPERGQWTGRVTTAAPDLEHRRPLVDADGGGEVREQFAGVARTDAVVQFRHLVEHPTEVTTVHRP